MREYEVIDGDGRIWLVRAASLEAARWYLRRIQRDPRPYEPGLHVRLEAAPTSPAA